MDRALVVKTFIIRLRSPALAATATFDPREFYGLRAFEDFLVSVD